MVGIQGLGGIPEPKPERPAKVRNERDSAPSSGLTGSSSAGQKDGVHISSEAQAAAEVARLVSLASGNDEVRMDKVEAARERIERGDYKNPDVVAQLAERLNKYL